MANDQNLCSLSCAIPIAVVLLYRLLVEEWIYPCIVLQKTEINSTTFEEHHLNAFFGVLRISKDIHELPVLMTVYDQRFTWKSQVGICFTLNF